MMGHHARGPKETLLHFAADGSVPIRELDRVNEHVETRIVRLPAEYRRSGIGGRAVRNTSPHDGYGNAASKIGRLNRSVCHHP